MAVPMIHLTPDLGWLNLDDMFDSTQNGILFSFAIASLDSFSGDIPTVRTPATLIFDVLGTVQQIPETSANKVALSSQRTWIMRTSDAGDVLSDPFFFELRTDL